MSKPSITLARRWHGHAHMPERGTAVETFLIRDDAALAAFIARIPPHRVQKKQPAPPSDDPLLARPAIDFASAAIAVIVRGDTLSAPLVTGVDATDAGVCVRFRTPRPPPEARPYGIGGYVAIELVGAVHAVRFERDALA